MSRVKPAVEQALKSDRPQMAVDAFFRTIDAPFWDHLAAERREIYRANLNAMLGDLQQPLYQVSTSDLAKIDRPCLMFYGSESQRTFTEIAKIVAGAIPHCRLVELQGVGHATYAYRPAEFAAAVREFALTLPSTVAKTP
jgi:pimeloyl-ACP methyl ester carboxylesterase